MISGKNPSPAQLSFFTALTLAIPTGIGFLLLTRTWWEALIATIVIFAGSYRLILFSVQTFIYRKIKLIYKLIQQTKATKREEFYYKNILPQKSIDEVREDVEAWALQRKKEIETLKQNEVFRKEFLQNLSHELKTPIFAIQGYIDTLLAGALHNEEVNTKFLSSAGRNVDRLVNLLDDLDEISKLESGTMQLHKQVFIIQDLVNEVFDTMFLKSKEKNIRTAIKKGCELPLSVYADKEKIRQVISNLVDNSIKYGKVNGIVEASFYKLDENNVLVEITDDGWGIAEDHLSRVFERFYRTDHARSRKEGGSGLGLAICKHIIEAHGREIHIRSKSDVGSSFGFTLPAKK